MKGEGDAHSLAFGLWDQGHVLQSTVKLFTFLTTPRTCY